MTPGSSASNAIGLIATGVAVAWPEKWIGLLIIILGVLVFLFGIRIERWRIQVGSPWGWKAKVNLYLLTMVLSAIVFVGAAIGYFIDRSRGPIEWTFGTHISPFGTWMEKGQPLRVDGFNIQGKNMSDDIIHPKAAYVRSDTNNRVIDLKFTKNGSGRYNVDTMDILPGGSFVLVGDMPSTDPRYSIGISGEEVRTQFGKFTFIFTYNNDLTYKRQFTKEETDATLTYAEKVNRDALESAGSTLNNVNSGLVPRNPP